MNGPLDGVRLRLVQTIDDVEDCRRWAGERRETPLFADTESGGLSPHRTRWRLGQLGDLHTGWAFPAEMWGGPFLEILSRYDGPIGFHNSPYDSQVLMVHGGWQPPWHKTEDTLLMGHIADSLKPGALKPRAVIEVDSRAMAGEKAMEEGMRKQHWTWDTVPAGWEPYWCYSALDPVLTAHLWRTFMPQVRPYQASYDLERATARICTNMMMAGMRIDVPFVQARIADVRRFHEQAMPWLRGEFGIESVNSNKQVGEALNHVGIPTLLFTDGGKPSVSKDALEFYAAEFPQHQHLLQTIRYARKAESLIGLLGRFLELKGSDDVMHYSIWSCRARTSRMTITDPAMQTFDRDEPIIRGCFVPRPGNVLITIDADQIEARLAAHFSGDERMIADFRRATELDEKFFCLMASKIYGQEISKKDPRYTWTKNACVPLDSQILTRRGWLRYDEVQVGDETIGLNIDTGHSEWTAVTGVHVYENSPVQSIGNNDRFRLRATPDHRWAVRRTYGKSRAGQRLEMVHQCDLNQHRDEIVLAAPLDDQGTVKITDQEAQVLGWLLSDGRLTISYEHTRVHKRKVIGEIFQAEHKHADEIRRLLSDIPNAEYSSRPGYCIWHIRPAWLRPLLIKTGLYDRWLPAEILACSLAPRSRALIAETMRKADGDPFVKGDEWRADFYATLLYLLGETPRVRIRPPDSSAWQKKDCWSVGRTMPKITMQRVTVEDLGSEPVWCVTTGLGTWTMRQDKILTVTGNTYAQIYGSGLEKAAATAGVPVLQMQPVYAGFRQLYPRVGQLMDFLIREGKSTRRPRVQTLIGRWLHTYKGKEYALLNTKIQGSAAEIFKTNLVKLDAAGYGPYLRLPQHDEVVCEVPAEHAAEALAEMTAIMTDMDSLRVPLTWSGSILTERWAKT